MERLRLAHLRLLTALRRAMHGEGQAATLAQRALALLGEEIPHLAHICCAVDPSSLLLTRVLAERNLDPRYSERYWREFYLVAEPLPFPALAGRGLVAERLSQTAARWQRDSPEAAAEAALEAAVLAPQGLSFRRTLVIGCRTGRWYQAVAALLRATTDSDFDESETRLAALAAPHLAAGLRAATLREAASVGAAPGVGALVLSREGHLLHADPIGDLYRRLLGGEPGVAVTGDLPLAVLSVVRALELALSDDEAGIGSVPAVVAVARIAPLRLILRASLLDAAESGRPAVLVLIERAPPTPRLDSGTLEAWYGLTRREVQVSEMVLQGLADAQIASLLGISCETVRDHLKHLSAKLQVAGRRALVGALLSHPAWLQEGCAPPPTNGGPQATNGGIDHGRSALSPRPPPTPDPGERGQQ